MNKRQKIVQEQFLNNEEAVIKRLKQVYNQSSKDITGKIASLDSSISALQKALADVGEDGIGELAAAFLSSKKHYTPEEAKATLQSMLQSKVYQKKYQQALKKQVSDVLDTMHKKEFKTVEDYLNTCYEEGFLGTMYDLQGQGIPLCFPMDQEAMVRAVQLDSKISQGLYERLGEDVSLLKKKITAQVSRGIATGMSFQQVAKQLAGYTNIGFNNAVRIARTEGHRIQVQSGMDACYKAKEKGADVVKQWDAALDARTRDSHARVDGEIRELDEKFSNGLMFPGDPAGGAAEVINCRCALLQRARWALDGSFTKMNNFTKQLETFESPEAYDEFKKGFFSKENKKYMNHVQKMEKKYKTKDFATVLDSMTELEYKRSSKLLESNPVFNAKATKPAKKVFDETTIDGVDAELKWLEERMASSFDLAEWVEIEEEQARLMSVRKTLLNEQNKAADRAHVQSVEERLRGDYFTTDTKRFITQVDLSDCDARCADAVIEAYNTVFEQMPCLRGKFSGIVTTRDISAGAAAATIPFGGFVELNAKQFSDYNTLLRICEGNYQVGFLVERTPAELVIHELGHAMAFFANCDWTTDAGYQKAGNITSVARRVKNAVMRETGLSADQMRVSHYGATDDDEWFAEVFTLYVTGRLDDPIVQSFGRQIEKIIKRMG